MDDPFAAILGESAAAEEMRAFARLAARVDAPVLLTGESGTGKGILAHAIHRTSARASHAFVAVNCAGVPESLFESEFFGYVRGAFTGAVQTRRGLLEQAHRGSLFLDEVGELRCGLQAKLLTALELGEFRRLGAESTVLTDARVIAATSADLELAVQRGDFRIDFYHRLLVLSFRLPPLRNRGADVALLSRHYLDSYARKHRRSVRTLYDSTLLALERLAWPGNGRQLAHAIETAVLVCDGAMLLPAHLPPRLLGDATAGDDNARRYSFFGGRAGHAVIHALAAGGADLTRTHAAAARRPADRRNVCVRSDPGRADPTARGGSG